MNELRDLNKIVKQIIFTSKKGKVGKNYFVKLELINGKSTEMFCEKEVIDAINALKEIEATPIKQKVLVEEMSEDKGVAYTCVLITLADGSDFRFFPRRAFGIVINATYMKYEQDLKNKNAK